MNLNNMTEYTLLNMDIKSLIELGRKTTKALDEEKQKNKPIYGKIKKYQAINKQIKINLDRKMPSSKLSREQWSKIFDQIIKETNI